MLPVADRAAFRTAIMDRLVELYAWFASRWNDVDGHLDIAPHLYHDWTDDDLDKTDMKYEADLDILWGEGWTRAASIFLDAGDNARYTNAVHWAESIKASIEDYAITPNGGLAYGIKSNGSLHTPENLVYPGPNTLSAFYWGRRGGYDYILEQQHRIANPETLFPNCNAAYWHNAGTVYEMCLRREWVFAGIDYRWGDGENLRALLRLAVLPMIPRDIAPVDYAGGWIASGGVFPYPMSAGVALQVIYDKVQRPRRL
jgi:hypothetical protein